SRRRHTRCLSDWSSDVCSSDLHLGSARGVVKAMLRKCYSKEDFSGKFLFKSKAYAHLTAPPTPLAAARLQSGCRRESRQTLQKEIGRASCRERVWRCRGGEQRK